MDQSADIFDQIVHARRSVRIYDGNAFWDESAVERSLERAVLAPNSSNLQLWEFYRVRSTDKLKALADLCLGQKAASTARELIVVVTRKDKWKERSRFVLEKAQEGFTGKQPHKEKLVERYYNNLIPGLYRTDPVGVLSAAKKISVNVIGAFRPMTREVSDCDVRVIVHKSAALAAQTFMLSMKAEGYDSCPMEGFDSRRVKKLFGLPSGAEINMIISVGTAKPEGIYGPRVRLNNEEVIFTV